MGKLFDDKQGYVSARDGDYWVALATELSPELQAEGAAREIVRRLQTMRRSAGFEIVDHITVYYQGTPAIQHVMEQFADYIRQETLSRQLISGAPPEGAYTEKHRLLDDTVLVGVKKGIISP